MGKQIDRELQDKIKKVVISYKPRFERYEEVAKKLRDVELPESFAKMEMYRDHWKTVTVIGNRGEQQRRWEIEPRGIMPILGPNGMAGISGVVGDAPFAKFPTERDGVVGRGYLESGNWTSPLAAGKGYLFGAENANGYYVSIYPTDEAPNKRNNGLTFGEMPQLGRDWLSSISLDYRPTKMPAICCYVHVVGGPDGLDFEITRLGPKPLKIYEESGKTLFTL